MMFCKHTLFSTWASTFKERGAKCGPGNGWSLKHTGKTIEEVLLNASNDPSFRPGWAAWAFVEYYEEADALVKELLLRLVCKRPVVAALLLRKRVKDISVSERAMLQNAVRHLVSWKKEVERA